MSDVRVPREKGQAVTTQTWDVEFWLDIGTAEDADSNGWAFRVVASDVDAAIDAAKEEYAPVHAPVREYDRIKVYSVAADDRGEWVAERGPGTAGGSS